MKKPNTFRAFLRDVHGLERHRYAPELNILHLKNGMKIKTPQCTTIEEAYLFIKHRAS